MKPGMGENGNKYGNRMEVEVEQRNLSNVLFAKMD